MKLKRIIMIYEHPKDDKQNEEYRMIFTPPGIGDYNLFGVTIQREFQTVYQKLEVIEPTPESAMNLMREVLTAVQF